MPPLGPLYGRDTELSTVVASLSVDGGSVTLTGLPGSGATTMVEHALQALLDSGVDAGDPEQWLRLDGLQLTRPGALAARLADRELPGLVVLEHAGRVPHVDQLLDWLRRAGPGRRVLASARGPLRYRGEQVVRLGPLPLEDPGGADGPGPAARLFLDVAARVGAPVTDAAALADVTEVCRLVGALPRSIEVVAARSPAFSPRTLVGLLARPDSHLLAGDRPGTRPQQEALAWSLSLLSAAQLRTLQTLAVTQVPVTLDELTRLSGQPDLVPGLSGLVDAHLVLVHRGATASTYTLPVLVREHLAAAGPPHPEAVARHTALSVQVADQLLAWRAAGLLSRARHRAAALEADLVAALDRALARRSRADAVTLAVALAAHWFDVGPLPEHAERLTIAWGVVGQGDAHGRADEGLVLQLRAWQVVLRTSLATSPSQVADQARLLPDIVRDARVLGPRALLAVYQVVVPLCALRLGREPVGGWLVEARGLALELRDPALVVVFAAWSAVRAYLDGDQAQTALHLRTALTWGEELPDQSLLVPVQGLVHRVAPVVPTSEVRPLGELIALAHALRDTRTQGWLESLAMVQALAAGDQAAAAALAVSTLRRVRLGGSHQQAREVFFVLFLLASARGELAAAGWLLALVEDSIDMVWPALSPQARQLYRAAVHRYSTQLVEAGAGEPVAVGSGAGTDELVEGWTGSDGGTVAVDGPLVVESALAIATRIARGSAAPVLLAAAPAAPGVAGPARGVAPSAPGVAGPAPGVARTTPALPLVAADPVGFAGLSEREVEVLGQLAHGLTNREISRRLQISPKTVMHHTSAIYRKLDVRSRSEAVARFLRMTGGAAFDRET